MNEGMRIGLQAELLVRSGRLGRPAVARSKCLSQFRRFHLVGLVSAGLAFSTQAQSAVTNFGAAVSGGTSERASMPVIATEAPENDQSLSLTKTLTNEPNTKHAERNAASNPSIGVELVCGLVLFFWVQRFRNFSV
jgi:hypothetical protein